MRLFAAVFPPPAALDPLHEVVRRFRPTLPQLTWVASELWHITLAFFGEVAADDVEPLREHVATATVGREGMVLRLSDGGAFPDTRDARVVWAGVSGDLPQLAALAGAVALEPRPFHPHLTLARVRRQPAVVAPLVSAVAGVTGPAFTVDQVVLMHSAPGTGGTPRHYTPLANYPL